MDSVATLNLLLVIFIICALLVSAFQRLPKPRRRSQKPEVIIDSTYSRLPAGILSSDRNHVCLHTPAGKTLRVHYVREGIPPPAPDKSAWFGSVLVTPYATLPPRPAPAQGGMLHLPCPKGMQLLSACFQQSYKSLPTVQLIFGGKAGRLRRTDRIYTANLHFTTA